MQIIQQGQLKGAFRGFHSHDTIFEFVGGSKWRQSVYKYHYHYAYTPSARVVSDGGAYYLEVDGMGDSVQVVRE